MERKPDWLPGFPVQIYCNRSDKYLWDHRIDPHEFKREVLGRNAEIKHFDVYEDRDGFLWLLEKSTGKYIETFNHINMYMCP